MKIIKIIEISSKTFVITSFVILFCRVMKIKQCCSAQKYTNGTDSITLRKFIGEPKSYRVTNHYLIVKIEIRFKNYSTHTEEKLNELQSSIMAKSLFSLITNTSM
jgi:hypothetical protein